MGGSGGRLSPRHLNSHSTIIPPPIVKKTEIIYFTIERRKEIGSSRNKEPERGGKDHEEGERDQENLEGLGRSHLHAGPCKVTISAPARTKKTPFRFDGKGFSYGERPIGGEKHTCRKNH